MTEECTSSVAFPSCHNLHAWTNKINLWSSFCVLFELLKFYAFLQTYVSCKAGKVHYKLRWADLQATYNLQNKNAKAIGVRFYRKGTSHHIFRRHVTTIKIIQTRKS
jgi:hypothetical protein